MKHRWHQTINNTVCYYQTLFDISLILEQVSNCNDLLREKIKTDKASCIGQNNMISDITSFMSNFATANEHAPKGLNEKT